ncbi:hypothetical protein KMAL_27660 [Novacetimonas maltaceti]|uniref:Uncharacterized protein n=1 Tax=Novacetimonas maltaceti TaxID=1203393 RepID=A0A2S3VYA3_9PROT|nr:hypothetical protein KMAL_27660 [Novacetimonas maltaceti]
MIVVIITGLRPYRSAARPHTNAPMGRVSNVSVGASSTASSET